jgi:sugar phosphate permease
MGYVSCQGKPFGILITDRDCFQVGGHPGWAWIFILEGIITLLVAIIAYWAINDAPAT